MTKHSSYMEREIWEILKTLDKKKITVIEAHKKLCGLYEDNLHLQDLRRRTLSPTGSIRVPS